MGARQWLRPTSVALADAMASSYRRLTGLWLCEVVASGLGADEIAEALYDAPLPLLCHDGASDPRFIYANRTAQRLWALSWGDFVGMPSRLSAEADQRQARATMLAHAAQHGYFTGYQGIRIDSDGRRFRIFNTTVFNVSTVGEDDDAGVPLGQAAAIGGWEPVR